MKKRKWFLVFIIIIVILVIRIIAPFFLKNYANKSLNKIEGYTGIVEDVDLKLYRGAYIIDSVYFLKKESNFQDPFMVAKEVDISLDWRAFFKYGKAGANIVVKDPGINFIVAWDEKAGKKISQMGKGVSWMQHFKKMSPLKFNRLTVKNGTINYLNKTTNPKINVSMDSIEIHAYDLQNYAEKDTLLPGRAKISALVFGNGRFNLDAALNFTKKVPDADIEMELEGVNLVEWNDVTNVFMGLDFESGTFNYYSEINLHDNKIDGYIKPVTENITLLNWDKEKEGFLDKVWEATAGALAELFENQEKDELATRVPISGDINNVDANIWKTFWNTFKNAFVDAFEKELTPAN